MKSTYKSNFLVSLILTIAGGCMLIYSGTKVFSYVADTAYTEFYFTGDFGSGDQIFPIFNLDGSNSEGTATGSLSFVLENLSPASISGKFSFVDAVSLAGISSVYGCKGESDSQIFPESVSGENNFNLSSGSSGTYVANLSFSGIENGSYTGCVVYTPNGISNDSVVDAVPRKALIFAVNLTGMKMEHQITILVNQGSRWLQTNPNRYGFESTGLLMLYRCDTRDIEGYREPDMTGLVTVNNSGYGISDISAINGCYDVLYKGWNNLAIYLTGFDLTSENTSINFVTGGNIIGEINYIYNNEEIQYNSGKLFVVAGDMPNSVGLYNGEVNIGDYTVVVDNACNFDPLGKKTNVPICDLNHDGKVDVSDTDVVLSVLGNKYVDITQSNGMIQNMKGFITFKFDVAGDFYDILGESAGGN